MFVADESVARDGGVYGIAARSFRNQHLAHCDGHEFLAVQLSRALNCEDRFPVDGSAEVVLPGLLRDLWGRCGEVLVSDDRHGELEAIVYFFADVPSQVHGDLLANVADRL